MSQQNEGIQPLQIRIDGDVAVAGAISQLAVMSLDKIDKMMVTREVTSFYAPMVAISNITAELTQFISSIGLIADYNVHSGVELECKMLADTITTDISDLLEMVKERCSYGTSQSIS